MNDPNDYIRKYIPHSGLFSSVEPLEECDIDWEQPTGPQWEPRDDTSMPRVVPPERKVKQPMSHDGGPGVKDHSLIKSVLRRSGLL
jgi:hypothetical protein